MNPLIGRKRELKRLRNHLDSRKSEFVAVYGRRRVGKTFLIRKAFENLFTFQMTGIARSGKKRQLAQFHAELVSHAPKDFDFTLAEDWFEAFRLLIAMIEQIEGDEKKVIFIDELPWLHTRNSDFLVGLEHFWNSWASARNDILLVVCGSAASWIVNNLLRNTGGLYNRITDRIRLEPLTLAETEEFIRFTNPSYSRYQITLLFMVFGGIPFYLDFLEKGMSAMQNINRLCFERNAPLQSEYKNLYASLFKKHERHEAVIEALATKGAGLTRIEISKISGLSNGGGLTRILDELEESSFIRKYRNFGKKSKTSLFQLTDLYSLFYHRFIKKVSIDDDDYWLNSTHSPEFHTWSGYAFEMVCLHHVRQIKKALGISGVQTSIYAWHSPKAQVDLVIDRKDQVINLCEMKFSLKKFTIDKKYDEVLRNKVGWFQELTGSKKALFTTLITTYGVEKNGYWGNIQNDLEMDILFEPD